MNRTYTIKETAHLLKVSQSTVRKWISDGKLVAARHPLVQRWVISEGAIEKLKAGITRGRHLAPRGKEDVEVFLALCGGRAAR